MAGMVSLWGASSLIKSVQAGTLQNAGGVTNTATINAVVPENSMLICSFLTQAGTASDMRNAFAHLALTNATTLTLTINANAGYFTTIGYIVVEFMPGVVKSIQRILVTLPNPSSGATGAITEVNTSKAWLNYLGANTDAVGMADSNAGWFRLSFASSTSVQVTRNTVFAATCPVAVQVVEFF